MGDWSKTSICNSGLGILGKPDLVRDAESGAAQEYGIAATVVRAYDERIGRVLRSHPWNFAMARVSLDADATAPPFGFARRFPLPSDCARVWKLDETRHGRDPKYAVEGQWLLTDETAPLLLIYIRNERNPSKFTDDFAEALAGEIAKKSAVAVLGSLEAADFFRKLAKEDVGEAKTNDGQENPPQELDEGSWLRGRRTG
ncbi:hypothetical protein [Reyranella sp.]|uniref:hypothetical protein n=1 Tax=Reyranella sp. TaxID=1929291 RepID=UPI003D133560